VIRRPRKSWKEVYADAWEADAKRIKSTEQRVMSKMMVDSLLKDMGIE
jgi:hypothetical protein